MKYLILIVLITLSGCVTYHIGELDSVSDVERDIFTCDQIALEQMKVNSFEEKIVPATGWALTSTIVFGDSGYGNRKEREAAQRSADLRALELQTLSTDKGCQD